MFSPIQRAHLKKSAKDLSNDCFATLFYSDFLYKACVVGSHLNCIDKKGKRKVQGVPQSQTAALPRYQEEEETDKYKQAQIEQTYEKH